MPHVVAIAAEKLDQPGRMHIPAAGRRPVEKKAEHGDADPARKPRWGRHSCRPAFHAGRRPGTVFDRIQAWSHPAHFGLNQPKVQPRREAIVTSIEHRSPLRARLIELSFDRGEDREIILNGARSRGFGFRAEPRSSRKYAVRASS